MMRPLLPLQTFRPFLGSDALAPIKAPTPSPQSRRTRSAMLLGLSAGLLMALFSPHTRAQSAYPPMEVSAETGQAAQGQTAQPRFSQRTLTSPEQGQEYASLDDRIESVVRRTLAAQQRAEAAERERMNMARADAANGYPIPLNQE
jgi:hypothetical protein